MTINDFWRLSTQSQLEYASCQSIQFNKRKSFLNPIIDVLLLETHFKIHFC